MTSKVPLTGNKPNWELVEKDKWALKMTDTNYNFLLIESLIGNAFKVTYLECELNDYSINEREFVQNKYNIQPEDFRGLALKIMEHYDHYEWIENAGNKEELTNLIESTTSFDLSLWEAQEAAYDDDLLSLEQQMLENRSDDVLSREIVFSYLETHTHFFKKEENKENHSIRYYFHNPSNGYTDLFLDIPKFSGEVYTDEGSCLGKQDWFDDLYEITKKMYEHNFK